MSKHMIERCVCGNLLRYEPGDPESHAVGSYAVKAPGPCKCDVPNPTPGWVTPAPSEWFSYAVPDEEC